MTTSPHAHLATLIEGTVEGPNTINAHGRTIAFYFGGRVRLLGHGWIGNVSDGPEVLAERFWAAVGSAVAS